MDAIKFEERLQQGGHSRHPVVSFDPIRDHLLKLDFTQANKSLTSDIIEDTGKFSAYISEQLARAGARYGMGGYDEHRTVYSRSKVFDALQAGEEPRRLHLGTDIWGKAGEPVFAPLDARVHSFAFNDHYGDYGATIILVHEMEGFSFHSLYGHLSLKDLNGMKEGQVMKAGKRIAAFGEPSENGHWPPHLHFQLIIDMEGKKGDYPGVCKFSERKKYLANCPDPDGVLGMMQYV